MTDKNNTEIKNTGDRNSGYGNSGDWNSGYGNSTNRETGIFNTTQEKIRCFNKETNLTWDEIDHPSFDEFYLNKWVSESNMTEEEKKNEPLFYVRGGYLKTYTWEEAWQNYWKDSDEEEKQKVLNLPNFDADIFKEITGIDVNKEKVSLSGKEVKVTLDGVEYVAIIK